MSRPIPPSDLRTFSMAISGMTCGSCVRHVHQALTGLDGVHHARVERDRGQAVISYAPNLVAIEDLARVVEEAGYSVGPPA